MEKLESFTGTRIGYCIRSACAPILVFPSLTAKLLPSGGFIGNKPNGSIAEGSTLLINVCLLFVGGEGFTEITLVFPTESTRPKKHFQFKKDPNSKSIFSGHSVMLLAEEGIYGIL